MDKKKIIDKHSHSILATNYNHLFAVMHILLLGGISASILFLVFTMKNIDANNPFLGTGIICISIGIMNVIIGYIGYKALRVEEKELAKLKSGHQPIILPSYISVFFVIITLMIMGAMYIQLTYGYKKNNKHFSLSDYKKISI